ncbi:hypothetical protein Tco_1517621 [Tanacetum coccineum]
MRISRTFVLREVRKGFTMIMEGHNWNQGIVNSEEEFWLVFLVLKNLAIAAKIGKDGLSSWARFNGEGSNKDLNFVEKIESLFWEVDNTMKDQAEVIDDLERFTHLHDNLEVVEIVRMLRRVQHRDMEKVDNGLDYTIAMLHNYVKLASDCRHTSLRKPRLTLPMLDEYTQHPISIYIRAEGRCIGVTILKYSKNLDKFGDVLVRIGPCTSVKLAVFDHRKVMTFNGEVVSKINRDNSSLGRCKRRYKKRFWAAQKISSRAAKTASRAAGGELVFVRDEPAGSDGQPGGWLVPVE